MSGEGWGRELVETMVAPKCDCSLVVTGVLHDVGIQARPTTDESLAVREENKPFMSNASVLMTINFQRIGRVEG